MFVFLVFVTTATLQENGCRPSYRLETYRIDGQWLGIMPLVVARWQHPAVGRGARFDVSVFPK